jgi:hypothetical protein
MCINMKNELYEKAMVIWWLNYFFFCGGLELRAYTLSHSH